MTDGIYRLKAEVGGFDLDVVDCQSQNGRRTDVGPDRR
jgi:hypothetical protein